MPKPHDTSAPPSLGWQRHDTISAAPRLSAWMACATNAVPLWVALMAMIYWGFGPVHPLVQVLAYAAVLTLWIWLFKPWAAPRTG